MTIEFYKYQGTGNDFIVLDNRNEQYAVLRSEQINQLCDRRFGVGADGLMLLCNKAGFDFEMIYFNADGHTSSMCGNGGRCMVKFAFDLGLVKTAYHFLAIDGEHVAEIDRDIIRLKMKDVEKVDEHATYAVLNTGSPHFVKYVSDLVDVDVFETGREIRNSKEFQLEGINVNFVEATGEDSIFVRTYERGVEDETFSCGTGVTAAALMSAHNEKGFNRVKIKTPGGLLAVEFDKLSGQEYRDIWLCGPAEFVYKGVIDI